MCVALGYLRSPNASRARAQVAYLYTRVRSDFGRHPNFKDGETTVLASVVPPMIGGAIYGAIAVALPLTLGDGASQLPNAIAQVPRDAVALAFLSLARALSFSHAHSLRELGRLRQIALHVAPLGRQRDRRDGRR